MIVPQNLFVPVLRTLVLCVVVACAACPGREAQADSLTSAAVIASPDAPQIIVTLSRPSYTIRADARTGAPQMPRDVAAFAEVRNWPADVPKPTAFVWHVYLKWTLPGWEGFETRHPIEHKTFLSSSPFCPDLTGAVRGGTLLIYAKATLQGREIFGVGKAQVYGENPSRKCLLAAYPPSRFGQIASKVGMAESGLHQFNPPGSGDSGGMPVVSSTGDIGVMQLNAPTGAVLSSDQVWDWRANVRQGMAMLIGKQRTSITVARKAVGRGWQRPAEQGLQNLARLNAVRLLLGLSALPAPAAPPLSDRPGSGMVTGDSDPDHVGLNQLERDAIRRYNGGREYAFTIIPDPDRLTIARAGWEVDPTRGGISPRSGAPDYVRRVLASRSGFTFSRPAAHKTKTGKRHRTRRKKAH